MQFTTQMGSTTSGWPSPLQIRWQGPMTVRIHPDNPKLFEFNGRPLVLLCATEHYGEVVVTGPGESLRPVALAV